MTAESTKRTGITKGDQCRTCGAAIIWAWNNVTRRAAPIDPEPADNGNIELLGDGRYRVLTKSQGPSLFNQELHLNHWVTCPNPPQRKTA